MQKIVSPAFFCFVRAFLFGLGYYSDRCDLEHGRCIRILNSASYIHRKCLPSPRTIVTACAVIAFVVPAICEGIPKASHRNTVIAWSGCYARLEEGLLTAGNSHFERRWRITDRALVPDFLLDRDNAHQWLVPSSVFSSQGEASLEAEHNESSPNEKPSLQLAVQIHGDVIYHLQIFPDVNGVRLWVSASGKEGEGDFPSELLRLKDEHLLLKQIILRDKTDTSNELVHEQVWLLHPNEDQTLKGNLFVLRDTLGPHGLVFLREAPEPEDVGPPVLKVSQARSDDGVKSSGHTVALYPGGGSRSYRWIILSCDGSQSGIARALQTYQRSLRVYRPERDGLLLSNTWGDRSGPTRISSNFIHREIDVGHQLGVDVMEVDDGWQSGQSSETLEHQGAYELSNRFWEPNKARIPAGLKELSDYAHQRNMKIGLWFAPDGNNSFEAWRRDTEQLVDLHLKFGIDAFKLDMVHLDSRCAEERFAAMLSELACQNGVNIPIDLDITAWRRFGYWGDIPGGTLYVENRYTDRHSYWPHQTLRNLWMLSQYVDPLRLRMEFLNGRRHPELYPNDPLAPIHYSASTTFATVMLASPLAFMELTSLAYPDRVDLRHMIRTWKRERQTIYSGFTLPIGSAPDGEAWTGFYSCKQDSSVSYLLIFRELNRKATWSLPSSALSDRRYKLRVLAGSGSVRQQRGEISVTIPRRLGFVFAKLERSAHPRES